MATTIIAMEAIECPLCRWVGQVDELVPVNVACWIPGTEDTDIITELACPVCKFVF